MFVNRHGVVADPTFIVCTCAAPAGSGGGGEGSGGSGGSEGGPSQIPNSLMLGLGLMGALVLYQVCSMLPAVLAEFMAEFISVVGSLCVAVMLATAGFAVFLALPACGVMNQ